VPECRKLLTGCMKPPVALPAAGGTGTLTVRQAGQTRSVSNGSVLALGAQYLRCDNTARCDSQLHDRIPATRCGFLGLSSILISRMSSKN
jgi:hypothetical protein